jgi:hypothetical protein
MERFGFLIIGLLVSSCTQSGNGRADSRTRAEDIDTSLVRRVCVADADSLVVGPDSLFALARSGCLMRDQRRPSRIP